MFYQEFLQRNLADTALKRIDGTSMNELKPISGTKRLLYVTLPKDIILDSVIPFQTKGYFGVVAKRSPKTQIYAQVEISKKE